LIPHLNKFPAAAEPNLRKVPLMSNARLSTGASNVVADEIAMIGQSKSHNGNWSKFDQRKLDKTVGCSLFFDIERKTIPSELKETIDLSAFLTSYNASFVPFGWKLLRIYTPSYS
jgi:hypothetical protein